MIMDNLTNILKLTASKIKVRDSHEFHELARISEMNYQNNSCKFV